ncbi:hypothetical protein [Streptomyces atroolivaceus]
MTTTDLPAPPIGNFFDLRFSLPRGARAWRGGWPRTASTAGATATTPR